MKQPNEFITREEYEKLDKLKRMNLALDILAIVIFIVLFIYILQNIDYIKLMGSDVCKICQDKVGATCFKSGFANP